MMNLEEHCCWTWDIQMNIRLASDQIQHRNEEEHFGSISHFGTGDHISNKSLKPGSRPMSTVTTPRTISPHPNSSKYRTPSSKKSTPNFTPRSKRTTNQSLLQGHRTVITLLVVRIVVVLGAELSAWRRCFVRVCS